MRTASDTRGSRASGTDLGGAALAPRGPHTVSRSDRLSGQAPARRSAYARRSVSSRVTEGAHLPERTCAPLASACRVWRRPLPHPACRSRRPRMQQHREEFDSITSPTRRSTSLDASASPRATDPNTRTSVMPWARASRRMRPRFRVRRAAFGAAVDRLGGHDELTATRHEESFQRAQGGNLPTRLVRGNGGL